MSLALKSDCKVSAALSAAVLLVHGIAVACVWISLPWPGALVATLGLCLSAWAHWQRLRVQGLRRIEWRAEGLSLAEGEQNPYQVDYEGGAASGPYWALLRVRLRSGRIRQFFIPADALAPETFRRLRVWLRWHSRNAAQNGK